MTLKDSSLPAIFHVLDDFLIVIVCKVSRKECTKRSHKGLYPLALSVQKLILSTRSASKISESRGGSRDDQWSVCGGRGVGAGGGGGKEGRWVSQQTQTKTIHLYQKYSSQIDQIPAPYGWYILSLKESNKLGELVISTLLDEQWRNYEKTGPKAVEIRVPSPLLQMEKKKIPSFL